MFRKKRIQLGRWWQSSHSSKCYFTWEEALIIARKYHLEYEIKVARSMGQNPDEALEEWDLFPYDKISNNTK